MVEEMKISKYIYITSKSLNNRCFGFVLTPKQKTTDLTNTEKSRVEKMILQIISVFRLKQEYLLTTLQE